MLIGGPTPLLCCTASWAIRRSRKSDNFRPEKPLGLLAFAGTALAQGKVDLILVTHGHGDHLGDAMELAKTNDVPMWAPAGLNQTLLTLGLMPAKLVPRMSKGGTIEPFPASRSPWSAPSIRRR